MMVSLFIPFTSGIMEGSFKYLFKIWHKGGIIYVLTCSPNCFASGSRLCILGALPSDCLLQYHSGHGLMGLVNLKFCHYDFANPSHLTYILHLVSVSGECSTILSLQL